MVFKTIRHRLADKVIKKQLSSEKILLRPVAWNAVEKIGFIFQANNQTEPEEVEELVASWKSEGKQVNVLMYVADPKKISFKTLDNWKVCTKKDFSSSGVPKSEPVQQFIQQSFDLLVDLNISGQVRLYTVSVLSRATFKIGIDTPTNKHLPFLVDVSKSLEQYSVYKLGQELVHQLKKIQFA